MPDLVTHLAGAYLVRRAVKFTRWASIFYLGALLPDVLSRPIHLIWSQTFSATQALHSPAGAFFACWLISLFFRTDQRRGVFSLMFLGSLFHFLLDMLQKHLVGGYLWLFPFSLRPYSTGFFWPEDSLYFLPVTLLLVMIVYLATRQKKGAEV